jgi:hypothetical protein
MIRKSFFLTLTVFFTLNLSASGDPLVEKTAAHICRVCGEKNKSRLAVYNFTDLNDDETGETRRYTTRVISAILDCGSLKVIDPGKVRNVMDEQAKGMLGIVDDETAPEVGKLLGADVLIFGQMERNSVQLRLVDAVSGELIGATVEEGDGRSLEPIIMTEKATRRSLDSVKDEQSLPEIGRERQGDRPSKDEFRKSQIKKQLSHLLQKYPGLFMYLTCDDEEFSLYSRKFPRRYQIFRERLDKQPAAKKEKFQRTRKTIQDMKITDPAFREKINSAQQGILSGKR